LIVKLFLGEEKRKPLRFRIAEGGLGNSNSVWLCLPLFLIPNPKSQIRNEIIAGFLTNLDEEAQIFAAIKTASLEPFGQ
jgi:hypothetical protein